MQHPEGVFRDQRPPVLPDASDAFGDPHGVAAEQLVILRRPQVPRHPQLHDEVIHQLLGALFGKDPPVHVPLEIDVEEGAGAP